MPWKVGLKEQRERKNKSKVSMDFVDPYIANSSAAHFIAVDGRYDGLSQEQRSVEGL